MMGVNPLSHFFAWFLECATYLVFTIIILTLVLQCGRVLPNSDGFLLFLYLCDYGLSVLAFSYLISSFFDKTYIAGLSGSLIYILFFFPFIVVMAVETTLTFSQKTVLVRNFTCSHTELHSQSESEWSHFAFPQSLFSPTCFSYAGQYISRYEVMGEGKPPHAHSHTNTVFGLPETAVILYHQEFTGTTCTNRPLLVTKPHLVGSVGSCSLTPSSISSLECTYAWSFQVSAEYLIFHQLDTKAACLLSDVALPLKNPHIFDYVRKESVKLSGKYGIPAPWYFPFKGSFWADVCCCFRSNKKAPRGLLFTNIMERNLPVFFDNKEKGTGQRYAVTTRLGFKFNYTSFFTVCFLKTRAVFHLMLARTSHICQWVFPSTVSANSTATE